MPNSFSNNKIKLVEGLIVGAILAWFLIAKTIGQEVSVELMINVSFLGLFITMLVFRSSHLRHMYFAFAMLVLSMIENIFGFSNLLVLTSGLTINLLILGTLNIILLKYEP